MGKGWWNEGGWNGGKGGMGKGWWNEGGGGGVEWGGWNGGGGMGGWYEGLGGRVNGDVGKVSDRRFHALFCFFPIFRDLFTFFKYFFIFSLQFFTIISSILHSFSQTYHFFVHPNSHSSIFFFHLSDHRHPMRLIRKNPLYFHSLLVIFLFFILF